ncbi:hypothetical protein [cf. Phormidesmis sp. LEGE 11477]|uniref:hypothetical protein n=1 Tax=cf. Phormidesmis sp. LEGE 11477 TaxID=1828680 RepID=UPI001880704F|nr:hypothetical protein [cf. Phormidesmis sp. LEGE 11477]MBE9064114.1 hypothetical protein [cf. Phormidesmis sp. LEGE 11477]
MGRKSIPGKKQLTAQLLGWVYQALRDDAISKGYCYERSGEEQPRWGDYFKAIALGISSGSINIPQKDDLNK